MKKRDDLLDDEFVNSELKREVNKTRKKKFESVTIKADILKYFRIIQITNMILATIFLARQDFVYAQFLAGVVGLCTVERLWLLIFRNK